MPSPQYLRSYRCQFVEVRIYKFPIFPVRHYTINYLGHGALQVFTLNHLIQIVSQDLPIMTKFRNNTKPFKNCSKVLVYFICKTYKHYGL